MKGRVRELIQQGDRLFAKRTPLDSLWQNIAEQFYPERADFTYKRALGEEFASHLMSGVPVLARRDLANSLSAMLRPRGRPWFHARTDSEKINEDPQARAWLDWATDRQMRVMYDPKAQFVRATKAGDNDFAAFGQAVLQCEPNRNLDGLLYRAWHLRDVVWCENAELVIDTVHRKWELEARELLKLFPKTAAAQVKNCIDKEPYKEIKCRHIVMPSDGYDYTTEPGKRRRAAPYISIYVDIENDTILEEVPMMEFAYTIPRWVTLPGSQYASSPAVTVALPDARMLQQISLTLLEAGQKAVDPPMKAMGEVITGGVNLYAGGVTWVDPEYDETTGKALEVIPIDTRGLNWGVAMQQQIAMMIKEAFYLNKINMPDLNGDRTAYEVQKMVEEYVRQATPLFEPMEVEYNSGLCEKTFSLMLGLGAFGDPRAMPEILRGQDVRFQFDSPLQEATERVKAQTFAQAGQLLLQAVQVEMAAKQADSVLTEAWDMDRAWRDALVGIGSPADWMVDEKVAAERIETRRRAAAEAQAKQAELAAHAQTAQLAQVAGDAGQSMADARMKGAMADQGVPQQ